MANAKEISKAVNQVLGGIGSLVAGIYLGPAGAAGVQSAASGVDKLLDATVPGEDEKESQGSEKAAAVAVKTGSEIIKLAKAETNVAPAAASSEAAKAPVKDARSAEEILRTAGWEPQEILAALRGPKVGRTLLDGAAASSRPSDRAEGREEIITTKRT